MYYLKINVVDNPTIWTNLILIEIKSEEIYGINATRTHSYNENGTYYAIIAGVIEGITNFNTNGVVVWDKI